MTLLKLPKLRHNGGWNDAPLAIRNLLLALNRTYGKTASTRARDIPATDPDIFRYPIVYMHGRNAFAMSRAERAHLKTQIRMVLSNIQQIAERRGYTVYDILPGCVRCRAASTASLWSE